MKRLSLVCFVLSIHILGHVSAQPMAVSGIISTKTTPVQNAVVTFIDNSDTTRQFSTLTNSSGDYTIRIHTFVHQDKNLPTEFVLQQNYPNPFSSSTALSFRLNTPSNILITIYDVLGRKVRDMPMGLKTTGAHQLVWDGLDELGQRVSAGVYFCRLHASGKSHVIKMIVGARPFNSTLTSAGPSNYVASDMAKAQVFLQSTFTVRIHNSENTSPVIVPKQLENVTLENNATLNFTVDELVERNVATIFLDSTQQVISGFGAANILRWRPDMTADQIDKAFGTENGQVGLSILRLRIPPNENDFADNVRTAREAYARGVKIIASPWSPPASMKTNNNLVGGRLRPDAYADYADHLNAFADYMTDHDAPLHALSIQNEPDVTVDYESCDWNAAEMLTFVKEQGAAIHTDIIVPESFHFDHNLSDPILNDPEAAEHVAIIGGHIYGGGLSSYPLAKSKGKELWMTEHLDTDTTWTHVLATGKDIHDCMNAGMNAYIWWYIVRFYGPITENSEVSKRGYVMSQFARFIRPGFVRVFTTRIPQRQTYVTGYRDGAKIVIVAINQRSIPVEQTFLLRDGNAKRFTPFSTSQTENCTQQPEINTLHGFFHMTLPPSSITTFVSE